MATRYSPSMVKSGLVLCLDAASSRSYSGSGSNWDDIAGAQWIRGAITAATFVPHTTAAGPASFDFDGTGDYITLSTSAWGAESFCISMWIKANVLSGYKMLFGGSGYGGGNGIGHYLYDTSIKTWIAVGTGAVNIYTGQTLSTDTWYNIIFQRDYGVAFNWYLNGQNINNYSSNFLTTALSSPDSTIAKHYNDTAYNFNGKIPIVHVYNRALTAKEVTQNYNALKGRFNK